MTQQRYIPKVNDYEDMVSKLVIKTGLSIEQLAEFFNLDKSKLNNNQFESDAVMRKQLIELYIRVHTIENIT